MFRVSKLEQRVTVHRRDRTSLRTMPWWHEGMEGLSIARGRDLSYEPPAVKLTSVPMLWLG